MRVLIIIIFISLIKCIEVQASFGESIQNLVITASYRYGMIPDKTYDYQHLINGFIKAIHCDFGLQKSGDEYWHKYYFYPETGVSFIHYNLSNNQQLGSITGLVPYIRLRPIQLSKIYPSIRFGIGIVYANKPFHRLTNHHNLLTGSKINAALNSDIDLNFKVLQNTSFHLGLSVIHFSNGNTKIPNGGINIISSKVGLRHHLNGAPANVESIEPDQKKYEISFTPAISFTNIRNEINKGFNYYDFMLEASKRLTPIYQFGIGFDLSFNNADTANLFVLEEKYFPTKNQSSGVKISNQFNFNRLEFILQLGLHIFDSNRLYDWIIFRYRISNHIKLNMSYKSYLITGDHLSWGITFCY